ncbi:ABC-2 type transport system ATP-binding protein [Halobacillus dabanensis]|uniref:ABC-2 type transport system ATP-binding protein n=1 Tax=Halobacillus dabanensis TaxID=240302 RepID=A0A1I3WQ31_HALDA|nr:ATP-binding cassette domain-containing protein [Halobacillus dabanensis]SFK09289.1 ABC-2 type transport system ATP-binding protein [Halobacillus dabanensis]
MNEYVLKTNHLSKKYKSTMALDKVNISIKKGAIYGFIGQNGAGKSTLIRLVCGLARPTAGSLELFGDTSERALIQTRKRIGTIIEGPALYPNMTAAENLEAHRLLKGIPGKECIEKTLMLVGLQNTGKKKAKNFSLGMKQRLGIAIALLGDPEFLILDEPINGLDPMGVVEIRSLLRKLNEEHDITILISSHILSELHLLATHYGIIHNGKLIEQLSLKELNEKCQQYLHIKVNDPNKAATVLESHFKTTNFEVMPNGSIKMFDPINPPGEVSQTLVQQGLVIEELMLMGEDLETYFSHRIGGVQHG